MNRINVKCCDDCGNIYYTIDTTMIVCNNCIRGYSRSELKERLRKKNGAKNEQKEKNGH